MSRALLVTDVASIARAIRDGVTGSGVRIVAIDGRSGSGKSTLAASLAPLLDASVIDGDDFFAGGVDLRTDAAAARARDCIDWQRQRVVLEALRAGRDATYHAFDWDAFDGRLEGDLTHVTAGPLVILEGMYSARPELADLVALRLLVTAPDATRHARLVAREGAATALDAWSRQWHEAEAWYFEHVAPPRSFDLVIEG